MTRIKEVEFLQQMYGSLIILPTAVLHIFESANEANVNNTVSKDSPIHCPNSSFYLVYLNSYTFKEISCRNVRQTDLIYRTRQKDNSCCKSPYLGIQIIPCPFPPVASLSLLLFSPTNLL